MAKVRLAGSIIEHVLECDRERPPEEQSKLGLKCLNYDEWRQFVAILDRVGRGSSAQEALEAARKVIGIGLVYVTNMKIVDEKSGEEKEFELTKTGSELTKESMGVLMPWKQEIIEAIGAASQITAGDLKN